MIEHSQNVLERRAYHKAWLSEGRPYVSPEIQAAVVEPIYQPFVARILERVPEHFARDLLSEYSSRAGNNPTSETNTWLRESVREAFGGGGLSLAATDDEINRQAQGQADYIAKMVGQVTHKTPEEIIAFLENVCERQGVAIPKRKTLLGIVARMSDGKWWRRVIRRQVMKRREAGAIKAGFVHSRRGLYVSDDAMNRYQQAEKRSLAWIESMELINEETGEVLELADVASSNISNPAIRYAELMTRTKGEEAAAKMLGYRGLFITWTCPGRMHARHSKSGRANEKHDGTTPEQAHKYLNGQWKKTRSAIDRAGISLFGLRVVEPHQDGTPHWHMLIFVHPKERKHLIAIMRRYALEHDQSEPGAKKHRFEVKHINPAKGSAVGYVSKYIAKNIHGEGVGIDYESEGESATKTASRVVVWSKTWRVRQFQFFGDSPVTLWRELRRIRNTYDMPDEFKPYWQPADRGDWQGYMKAMEQAPLKLWTEEVESHRYPGEVVTIVRGVELGGIRLETRKHRWTLREKANADPWTRVNNCTGVSAGLEKLRPLPHEKDSVGSGQREMRSA